MSRWRYVRWSVRPCCAAVAMLLALLALPAALFAQQLHSNYFAPQVRASGTRLAERPTLPAPQAMPDRRTPSSRAVRFRPAALRQAQVSVQEQANREVGRLEQLLSVAEQRAAGLRQQPIASPQSQIHRVPIAGAANIDIQRDGNLVSLTVRDAVLKDVLSMLAETVGLNVVSASEISATVSITLERVSVEQALDSIVAVAGYRWTSHNGVIHVTTAEAMKDLPPMFQHLRVHVFQLDFVAAADIEGVVTGMLSPAGKAHTVATSPEDTRKSREAIVVEDSPIYLDRIAAYIASIDIPPRQVAIEAHVLQVELTDNLRHGVNLEQLAGMSNHQFTISTIGMATGMPQGLMAQVTGPNVNSLIELIKTTNDAKTLASPRLTVINGQTARLQVGEQLGFFVTTATETTALQSVEFLDVGVVLEVTPYISRDNHVMMRVSPEVSSGRVNPDTGLPEEETTEVQTSVLLESGKGVLLGGLIREVDTDGQGKVPFFGDLHIFGPLFQRREREKERSEIIIALIPRVLPMFGEQAAIRNQKLEQVTTPLLHGPLLPMHRPWEAKLPNAFGNPKHLCGRKNWELGPGEELGYPVDSYLPPSYEVLPDPDLQGPAEPTPPNHQPEAAPIRTPNPTSVIRQAEPFRAANRLPTTRPGIEHFPLVRKVTLPRLQRTPQSRSNSPQAARVGATPSNADRAMRHLR